MQHLEKVARSPIIVYTEGNGHDPGHTYADDLFTV
jgi:hypothetical protein